MARFFDFDQARLERMAEPPPVMLVFGEKVELPRSVPAAIHLAAARREGEPVTFAFLAEMLGLLVGQERVDRWVREQAIEEDDLRDLYYGAVRTINASDPDPEDEPPAAGEQGGQTSPSTGVQSSPISSASTAST